MSTFHYLPLDLSEVKAEINAAIKEAFAELEKNHPLKPVEDKIYTPAQAAKELSVSISTVNNWRRDGQLISGKIGGRVYITRSEIDQCIVKLNIKK